MSKFIIDLALSSQAVAVVWSIGSDWPWVLTHQDVLRSSIGLDSLSDNKCSAPIQPNLCNLGAKSETWDNVFIVLLKASSLPILRHTAAALMFSQDKKQ